MDLWTYDLVEEPDGYRWVISEGQAARAVSATLFETREAATRGMARFASSAEHLTWVVAPETLRYWFWLVTDDDGIVCCSGPCRGVDEAQAEGDRAKHAARCAVPVHAEADPGPKRTEATDDV